MEDTDIMKKIGIIGDFLKTAGIISNVLSKNSYTSKIINYKHFFINPKNNFDFLIIGISSPYTSSDYINKLKLDILIINDSFQITNLTTPNLKLNNPSIILLNSDKAKEIELKNSTPSYLITFGFNPKSTITVSSIETCIHNTMQISIQRTLPTLYSTEILEQDFSINIYDTNIDAILSAISTILVATDIDIENLKNIII